MCMVKIAWERLERWFMLVLPVIRATLPLWSQLRASLALVTSTSIRPCTTGGMPVRAPGLK